MHVGILVPVALIVCVLHFVSVDFNSTLRDVTNGIQRDVDMILDNVTVLNPGMCKTGSLQVHCSGVVYRQQADGGWDKWVEFITHLSHFSGWVCITG